MESRPASKVLPKNAIAISLAFIGAVFVIGALPATTLAATNLIVNPNLQNATVSSSTPDGWLTGGWGTNTVAFSYPVAGPNPGDVAAETSISSYTSGDAKWYFQNVPVTPAATYTFSDEYNSNTASALVAQFTMSDNSVTFDQFLTLPSSNGVWTNATGTFTAPASSTAVTVFHLIQSVGTIATTDYSLALSIPANQNLFPQGIVSLTFDDGWESQYQYALPILQSANIPASFYIITNAMLDATDGEMLCNSATSSTCDGAQISQTATSWTASGQYPDPNEATYDFQASYTANATATLAVSYFDVNGNAISGEQNVTLATLPAASTSSPIDTTFTIPSSVFKAGVNFTLSITVPSGKTLAVSNPSLMEPFVHDSYMTTGQVLALQADGEEVGAHTEDHCDLVMLENNSSSAETGGDNGPPAGACASQLSSPTLPVTEIDGSRAELLSIGIKPVITFAYPYGSYDANIEGLVKSDGFVAARTTNAGFNFQTTDPFALNTQIVDESTTFEGNGLATVESWINTAVANKEWVILMFHNVEPSSTLQADNAVDGTTPSFLQSIANYLKQNNVNVETVEQVLGNVTPTSTPPTPTSTPPAATTSTVNVFVTNNNAQGGTAQPSAFTVTVTGASSSPSSFAGNASGTAVMVNGGAAYAVAESSFVNYTTATSTGCAGTLSVGSVATCTITNTFVAPAPPAPTSTLTVNLVENGGTATPADFKLTVKDGTSTIANAVNGAAAQSYIIKDGDSYTVTEATTTNSAAYTIALGSACSGTISTTTACTVTNTFVPPPPTPTSTLNVIVSVNIGTSGVATASSFTITLKNNTSTVIFPGNASGTANTIASGTYAVTESALTNYKATTAGNCSGSTSGNQALICTVTETFSPPPPVPPPTITINPTTLPNGTASTSYSQAITASTTATSTFAWSISSGALPTGLSINTSTTAKSTTISGTPTTVGAYNFTVRVMNGQSSSTQSYTVNIVAPAPAKLKITPTSLPFGNTGKTYSQTITVTGAPGPFQWSVSSGKLPAGLSLNVSTSTGSVTISGTPTATGLSTFTIKVSYGSASITQTYFIEVVKGVNF